jgi:hypothetical protein
LCLHLVLAKKKVINLITLVAGKTSTNKKGHQLFDILLAVHCRVSFVHS